MTDVSTLPASPTCTFLGTLKTQVASNEVRSTCAAKSRLAVQAAVVVGTRVLMPWHQCCTPARRCIASHGAPYNPGLPLFFMQPAVGTLTVNGQNNFRVFFKEKAHQGDPPPGGAILGTFIASKSGVSTHVSAGHGTLIAVPAV